MGARHTVFAIEEPLFAELIERSVADVLVSLLPESDHLGNAAYCVMHWTSQKEKDVSIRFHGRGTLLVYINARRRVFEPDQLWELPELSLSVKDFVRSNSSYQLSQFLNILAQSRTYDFVRYLVDHLRRWWVFSLLESAEYWFGAESPRYLALDRLCHRFLRLTGTADELRAVPFPVLPQDDGDLYMGALSADETKEFLVYCEELLEFGAKFFRFEGISYPDTDEGWDSWVRTIIDNLLGMHRDGYGRPLLVGFHST